MGTKDNGPTAPFHLVLRDLPLPVRLTLTLFMLSVGLGYFSALVQLHFRNATHGQPLPTPNDVVEIFSGVQNWPVALPSPPPPVSKLERLIMGPEDESTAGGASMAKPFFMGDPDYKKRVEKDPSAQPRLHEEREGERLALQAWIHLPDDKRKAAYESDEMSPESLADPHHPLTNAFLDPNGQIRVNSIFHDRCMKCHEDADQLGKKKLSDYEDFADVLFVPTVGKTSRQMSLESLTQTTHLHLLSFCVLWTLTGLVFAFSSYPTWIRCILAPVVLLGQVADVTCWWLARLEGVGPYFALAIIGTGTVVGVGLTLQVVLSVLNMYRLPGKVVLLLLFAGVIAGGVLAKPYAEAFLTQEAAPPAAAK